MTTFFKGDIWKPEDTIIDPKTKAKVDPSVVTAEATAPGGAITFPAVTKLEPGVYQCSIPLTEAGKWHVVFAGSGGYVGAKPETITVYPVAANPSGPPEPALYVPLAQKGAAGGVAELDGAGTLAASELPIPLTLTAPSAGTIPLTLQGAAGQTAVLLKAVGTSTTSAFYPSGRLGIGLAGSENALPQASIHTRGNLRIGNIANYVGERPERCLWASIGHETTEADVADVHGANIIGQLTGVGVGATHKQAFGAEIEGSTKNVAGIKADSVIGCSGLAIYMSDQEVTNYVIGVIGTAQFGNSGTPTILGNCPLAIGVVAESPTLFASGWKEEGRIAKAIGLFAKTQANCGATFHAGVYSEDHIITAAAGKLGIGLGQVEPTTAAQVNGALTFGAGTAENTATGDVVGIKKLVLESKDANHAGNRIFVNANVFTLQTGSAGFTVANPENHVYLSGAYTGAEQRLAVYNATPVKRAAAIANPTEELKSVREKLEAALTAIRGFGITE